MKTLLSSVLVAFALLATAPAHAQTPLGDMSIAELQAQATELHPAALYVLAARLLAEGDGQAAAGWMYAGQIRYRFLIEAEDNEDERILFGALTEQVGRPVNEYIGGNVDEWLAAIDWALAWDAANPNTMTSKTEHATALTEVRAGLERLRVQIEEQREIIPKQRAKNGLENR
ncbi:hypothetical protein ACFSX5_16405 [Devosia albogilva]|uniref:Uncharacterized protein n=1 Tax=Devosia albogilva TaxID=429726 RepID=A0ABW5QPK8_9HYPH